MLTFHDQEVMFFQLSEVRSAHFLDNVPPSCRGWVPGARHAAGSSLVCQLRSQEPQCLPDVDLGYGAQTSQVGRDWKPVQAPAHCSRAHALSSSLHWCLVVLQLAWSLEVPWPTPEPTHRGCGVSQSVLSPLRAELGVSQTLSQVKCSQPPPRIEIFLLFPFYR